MSTTSSPLPVCPDFRDPTQSWARPNFDVTEGLINHLLVVLAFFKEHGLSLLKPPPEQFTYQEWKTLLNWAFQFWYWGVGGDHANRLFELTIERGIQSLAHVIKTTDLAPQTLREDLGRRGPIIGSWIVNLEFNLSRERVKCELERTRLIELMRDTVMIPVLHKLNREPYPDFFRTLAVNRFPGDAATQELFMTDCVQRATKTQVAKDTKSRPDGY